jgi:hypothetical protein
VVGRDDLPPATQAVQCVHAALEFADHWPGQVPQVLALLAVPDEIALCWLCADADRAGIRYAPFHEPDLGGALTAVALGPESARLCRKFRLLLREEVKHDN